MTKNKVFKILKKIRPFIGLILFISLILISTAVVFFSVASIFVYPLLWVIFITLNFIKPQKRLIIYCLNAVRLAMWVYYVSFTFLLLWTPEWIKVWSVHLERKTWWNVFKEGSYMCGRTSFSFILSLIILAGFWFHYKWIRKHEKEEENSIFTKSI